MLSLLAFDDATGALAATLRRCVEQPGAAPLRVWAVWIPQLLAGLGRVGEGDVFKAVLAGLGREHPQALYYPLRAFVLEKRESGQTDAAALQKVAWKKTKSELVSPLLILGVWLCVSVWDAAVLPCVLVVATGVVCHVMQYAK